jgi:hypothetical protein
MKDKVLLCIVFVAFALASLPAHAQSPSINPGGVCESQLDSLTNTYLCAPSSTLIDQTHLSIYGQNLNGTESITFNSSATGLQYLPIDYVSATQINICLYITETNVRGGTLTIYTSHGSTSFSSINVTTWQAEYGMQKCTS